MKPNKVDIAGCIVMVLLLGGGYFGIIQRQMRNYDELKDRITALNADALAADGLEVVLSSEERELDQMLIARSALLARIVSKNESDTFLAHFGAEAETRQIDVDLLRPRQMVEHKYFSKLPIDVHLAGSFESIYEMLRELEHGDWMAIIESIQVTGTDSGETCNVVMTVSLALSNGKR